MIIVLFIGLLIFSEIVLGFDLCRNSKLNHLQNFHLILIPFLYSYRLMIFIFYFLFEFSKFVRFNFLNGFIVSISR